jgi:phosphodiesterase/alkaline phosphatase D-like protein
VLDLAAATTYAMAVTIDGQPIAEGFGTGRVTTKEPAPRSLHMAAVSCNFTVRQGNARLWERLWDKWVQPGTVSTVLHIGDQIYGDSAFAEGLAEVRAMGRTAPARRRVRQAFERLYHMSWSHPATRRVLAHACNLMIWDDHEVRNSWGGYATDRDPDTDEFFVGSIAREVSQQYQRALWSAADASAPHEGHAHAYGELGVLFLDQRTARSFAHQPQRPYLGTSQWTWLRHELQSGSLSKVRALVLVTSVPLCYVSTFASNTWDWAVSDLRDHWTHPDHRTELVELLVELRRWLATAGREVLVLGGDVHVGGRTVIEHQHQGAWQPLCEQLITSPVTNRPPGYLAYLGLREALLRGVHDVNNSFRFDHDENTFTNRRNFAVLTLRARAGEPAKIHGSLELDADD